MTFDPQLAPELEDDDEEETEECWYCDDEPIEQYDFNRPHCYHHYMIDMQEDIDEARAEGRGRGY
jgi:hypothetical protein